MVMTPLERVIDWARQELPSWQADAVRRLLENDELSEQDRDELYWMARHELGLDGDPPAVRALLPKAGRVSGASGDDERIILRSISSPNNVNALNPDSALGFGHTGLTIIYGDNGSGKSAYARVLKRACRARDRGKPILPDVFRADGSESVSATINIRDQTTGDVGIPWTEGDNGTTLLTKINVFDSHCVRVTIDESNRLAYVPYGTDVFERLAPLVTSIKERILASAPSAPPVQTDDIPSDTRAGRFVRGLNKETADQEINRELRWTRAHDRRLERLRQNVAQLDDTRINQEVEKIETVRTRLGQYRMVIESALRHFNEEKKDEVRGRVAEVTAARQAAEQVAAERGLDEEPLPGAYTTDKWQLLYKAAREYSESHAYPEAEFPVVDDARCVFCMQEIGDEAASRLRRFHRYMTDTTNARLDESSEIIGKLKRDIESTDLASMEHYGDLKQTIGSLCPEFTEYFVDVAQLLGEWRAGLLRYLESEGVEGNLDLRRPSSAYLTIADKALEVEADRWRAKLDEKHAREQRAKLREAEARKTAAARIDPIREHIGALRRGDETRRASDRIGTRKISDSSRKLIRELLSTRLLESVSRELEDLGMGDVPIDLATKSREGETTHRMQFDGVSLKSTVRLSEVLSEGEQKAVGLAGFLAEIELVEGCNPVVLDDPVTSLDHRYRRRIAERLARLAHDRQVIVFTHELGLLVELRDAVEALNAAGQSIPLTIRAVQRTGRTSGRVIDEPWHTQNTKQRADYLSRRVAELRKTTFANDGEYNRAAAEIYGLLREAWEGCVEADLLNELVVRFRKSVETNRLWPVSIESDDVTKIDQAMSRCSEWMTGHDRSRMLDVNRPSFDDIEQDIDQLREFRNEIIRRREKTKKGRRDAVKPPAAEVG